MKPCMYGITSKLHRLTNDFLGNRSQEVIVNGPKSEHRMVKSGVPQGTVLGPLSFLVYINYKSPVLSTFLLMMIPFTD